MTMNRPLSWQPRSRTLAWLLAAALAAPLPMGAQAQVRLPSLGEAAADDFSVGTERALGDQIMREIRRDPDYLDDPVLLDYVQGIWQPLVEAARQRGDITPDTARQLAWEVFLVRDRSVNAFALPGGFVGIHLGLIATTGSSDELAAVLAHELSHVTQRHIARRIVSAKQTTLLSTAAMILGVLAASKAGSTDGVQAAVAGSQAASMQAQLNFSRDMEREADRVGFGVLTDAGYAPAGMAGMFDKLELASRMNDTGSFPYLRSHPLTIERISEARARAVASPAGKPEEPLNHLLMGARSRVLMDGQIQSLRRLQDRLGSNPPIAVASLPFDERLAVLYGGAFAAGQLREGEPARVAVGQGSQLLDGQRPANPAAQRSFALLDAQLALQRGDAAGAIRVLDAPRLQPPSRAALLLRAQAALGLARTVGADAPAGQAVLHRCAEDLQGWVALRRDDALAWELLGQCDGERGQRLRSLRAQAEARAALGDIAGAIDRLRAAQALVRAGGSQDHIEASVIDARLRELMALQRELTAAMRGRSGAPLAQRVH
jgi:predicted Zn-dependent protease